MSFQIALETCLASNSACIMSRSFTALQALLRLKDILIDCSDSEDANSGIDDALDNNLEVEKNQASIILEKTMTTFHRIKCR